MTTAFSLLLDRCGLSQREAAAFLGVRIDTVKSWSSGRAPVRAGAVAELRGLYARIERAGAGVLAMIGAPDGATSDEVELILVTSDEEARELGWPGVGAQGAVLGLVVARCARPVRVRE